MRQRQADSSRLGESSDKSCRYCWQFSLVSIPQRVTYIARPSHNHNREKKKRENGRVIDRRLFVFGRRLSLSLARERKKQKKKRKTLAVFITYPTRDRRCVDDCLVLCVSMADNASSISEMQLQERGATTTAQQTRHQPTEIVAPLFIDLRDVRSFFHSRVGGINLFGVFFFFLFFSSKTCAF